MKHMRAIAMALLASIAANTQAHDVTLFPIQDGEAVRLDIFYGDPGDYQPIDKIRFVELTSYDSRGTRIIFVRDIERAPENNKKLVAGKLRLGDFAEGTYVLSGRYDNGFYVHDLENRAIATTLEWKSDVIDSAHYLKFSKALFFIDKPGSGYDRVLGHRVEFVPLADPFSLKEGAQLPVRLLVDGQPKADYKVEVGDDTAASRFPGTRTDANGIFNVKLDHKGVYRLAVDYRAKSQYAQLYEWDDITASLVFQR